MNTDNLIRAITVAKIEFMKSNPKDPTKLYLDNVHAMKLEWYMKEHCIYKNDSPVVKDGVYYNGMRVFPVMVAEEHVNVN